MKSATVSEIKKELKTRSQTELVELCLHLSKFKKENKELLTYLLYEADDEAAYIENIKIEIDEQFEAINTSSFYFVKKAYGKSFVQQKSISGIQSRKKHKSPCSFISVPN